MTKSALALLAAFVASSVSAQSPRDFTNYVGIASSDIAQDVRYSSDERTVSTRDLLLTIGGTLTPYCSVEMRLGQSISDASTHTDLGKTTFTNDSLFGAFLRFQYPSRVLIPYAQAGWTHLSETVDLDGDSHSRSFSDLSWAAGIDYFLIGNVALHGEYFYVGNRDDVERSGPAVGLTWHF